MVTGTTYSGANNTPARIGTGHTHCTANGILYAHSSFRPLDPLLTAAAKNCPITQHMLINVVRYGRSTTGATSEAYAGVILWKAPHGIPSFVNIHIQSNSERTEKHKNEGKSEERKRRKLTT